MEFAHIDSEHAQPLIVKYDLQNIDSIIVIEAGKEYVRSNAVLRILAKLRWPYKLGYIVIVVPKFLRDWIYDIVARNRRKWFGRSTSLTCEFLIEGGSSEKDLPKQP